MICSRFAVASWRSSAVTGRISSQLTSWPQSAHDVMREVEKAYAQRIIQPDEFQQLKTVIVDTISQRQVFAVGAPGMPNPPPSKGAPAGHSNIALGHRLRDRFILDEVSRIGGMGIVYRGRDLLKVEARDRNPYVRNQGAARGFQAARRRLHHAAA
jgi:hypothetical protein